MSNSITNPAIINENMYNVATIIHYYVKENMVDVVKQLLDFYSDRYNYDNISRDGQTSKDIAIQKNNARLVEILLINEYGNRLIEMKREN